MEKSIENKVAKSGLITIDLETLCHEKWDIVGFDLAEVLWQGLVLKEKDFRQFVSENDWSKYKEKHVFIHCTADAIIPTWAYMLLAQALMPHAASAVVGSKVELETQLWRNVIYKINGQDFSDQRVVVKGCSHATIAETIYFELSQRLLPHVKSLMFGEPCSTVPIFKKK